MTIYATFILVFIAGLCNGIMDAIDFHDAYKNKGWWWSKESWKDLERNPTWIERTFKAAFNGWHIAKWCTFLCLFIAIALSVVSPIKFSSILMLDAYLFCLPAAFVIGFDITWSRK